MSKSRRKHPTVVAVPARTWRVYLAAGVIVAVGAAIYLNSFRGVFLFDDNAGIVRKAPLWRDGSIWQVVRSQSQTPVVALTFKLNYALGGLNTWGWHFVNLSIHLSAALTLFGVLRRTLLTDRLRGRFAPAATPLAAAVALAWMAHPLQTEAVTLVVQRKESLMATFYLLTLYCFIRGHGSPRRAWWLAAAAACCLLGMGCKQVMVTAPVMVLLHDRTFLSGSFRAAVRRSWRFYVVLAVSWLVLATSLVRLREHGAGVAKLQLGMADYAHTQFGAVLHYLRLAFWPDALCLDYADWPVARELGQWILPALAVMVLLAATAYLFWRAPAVGFAAAWVFIVLAPSSSVVVVSELVLEHRMYLPLAGLAVLAIVGGYALLLGLAGGGQAPPPARGGRAAGVAGAVLAAALVGALGFRTVQRNADYHSPLAMYKDLAGKRPGNARALANLARKYAEVGDFDSALEAVTRAIGLSPGLDLLYVERGNLYADNDQPDLAVADFTKAIELSPGMAEAWFDRGTVHSQQGDFASADRDYTEAIALRPDYAKAHVARAITSYHLKAYDRAWADVAAGRRLGWEPDPDFLKHLADASGRSE